MPRTGRPSSLLAVVDREKNTTTADRIVDLLRAGNYVETAAAAAGVDKTTLYDWLKQGARLSRDLAAQRTRRRDLSQHQRALVDFSNAVADAQAESESRDVMRLAQLANGGLPQVVETVKVDGNGAVIERTTKTEQTLPNAQVLEWRLERRHPTKWGRKQSLEHSGPGGGAIPVQVQAEQVVAVVSGILDDLGITITDSVRQVVAARLRGMGAQGQPIEGTAHELADAN